MTAPSLQPGPPEIDLFESRARKPDGNRLTSGQRVEAADLKNETTMSHRKGLSALALFFLTGELWPGLASRSALRSGIAGRFLIPGPAVTVEVFAATRPTPPGRPPSSSLFPSNRG
jgi:hypothetical protein